MPGSPGMPLALLIPPPLTISVIVGLEGVIVAAVLYLGADMIRRRSVRLGGMARPIAWVAGILGAVLLLGGLFADATPGGGIISPIPNTVTSATAGQNLYLANCAACHGVDARGGGPQAGTTQVRPLSLVSGHLNQHTDGDLFYWITNGLAGGMPSWAARLSDTDRWNLVNYLRSLNGSGGRLSPPNGPGTAPASAWPVQTR